MIFLYKFYNLHNLFSLHQQKFNHTSFETVLSLYEMKMNLCCKKPELFGNLPVYKMRADWATTHTYFTL